MTPWWESQTLDIAYSPLQDGAIRLIEFDDVDTTAAQHTPGFKIHHVLLEEAPPYCTLSYRWSSGKEEDEPTKTNGFWIDIRGGSLAAVRACLSQVKEKGILLFWIDQFCINQYDLTEKSQQVSLMASIYSTASTTVIWLGHPQSPTGNDRHFQASFSFLEEISRHWHRPDQYDSDSDNGEDAIKSQSTGVISALVTTLSAPWFGRTWVLQEALLSRDPVVLCGSLSLSWRSLVLAVRQLAETTALQVWFRSFLDRGKWNFHLQNASLFCNLYLDPDEDGLQRPESALKCLLLLCRSREASDRRDKVFALKGLCTPEDAPVVDYSVPEAVIEFVVRSLCLGFPYQIRYDEMSGSGTLLSESASYFEAYRTYASAALQHNYDFSGLEPEIQEELNQYEEQYRGLRNKASATSRGRRLFTTANGLIGLGPSRMRKGDVACILYGSGWPFILRPCGHNFQLVGYCFVDGMMHGEMVKHEDTPAQDICLVHHSRNGSAPTESLSLTGTVKLHGTHADGRIIAQSRNNAALSAEKDNFDFAKFCHQRRPPILRLASHIRARWTELHPSRPSTAATATLILAGEWIGHKIQPRPRTAVRDLSRRFVLCGIRLADAWEPIERYAAVADEPAALYNVGRGGFFRLALSPADRGAAFLAAARRLADEVGARCPFGAALGVEGPGEGIVWTPAAGAPNVPAFWLKTKGEGFEGRPSRVPAAPRDDARQEAAAAFARAACHERRLEQGWDYLREMHIPRDMTGLSRFMAWVIGDVEVEERSEIGELGVEKVWEKEAFRIGKGWYVRRLAEGEGGDGVGG
ncbi:hypothetical protein SLS56_005467 [Neofusicoccum ribis]|uniref:Heterokaryon incompatibility domain-containing protein n=1 Tax=Neofusicoccum ribis TaxID=45134 RepID=A0ABR3STH5_9PEZI